ncbi:transposase [Granulicella sp. L60]|uniref:IS110 family transposase n=1 Tax=Granulicella sp. L60 TaxID=1641866 RepID=UPI00131BB7FB|nr:transposase [Granulicella sp. L60]
MEYFVGIDWGTQTHRIAVLDRNGRVVEQFNAEHSGEGLVVLVNKLKQRTACDPALVGIGIEVAWALSWKLSSKVALPSSRSIPSK